MRIPMNELKREIAHLPPLARERAERDLGIQMPKAEHRVFVYGTLLLGERNARWALNATRIRAWTHGTLYDPHYGFPAFVREGEGIVKGELLTVDDEGFKSMDRLEGYPRLYRREEIEVCTASGGRARAWVYILNSMPKDATVIASGDWRNR